MGRNESSQDLARWVFLLGLLAGVSCSEQSNAGTSDDGGAPDAAGVPDAASSCGCTLADAGPVYPWGYEGNFESLACFCTKTSCRSYDEAVAACPSNPSPYRVVLHTYADCGLLAVEMGGRGIPPDRYFNVYLASTKELVGAFYATDVTRFTCGSRDIAALRAGTFPTGCTDVPMTICGDDAGSPRMDASSDSD